MVDVAKGAVPVALAASGAASRWWIPLLIGCAAVLGHVFSMFLRFRGGKGVATAAGVVLALAPAALGVSALVWILVLLATGFVSLASILGAVTFPIAVHLLLPERPFILWVGVALAVFIIYTHRSNIGRLLSGTENRFGRRAKMAGKDA